MKVYKQKISGNKVDRIELDIGTMPLEIHVGDMVFQFQDGGKEGGLSGILITSKGAQKTPVVIRPIVSNVIHLSAERFGA